MCPVYGGERPAGLIRPGAGAGAREPAGDAAGIRRVGSRPRGPPPRRRRTAPARPRVPVAARRRRGRRTSATASRWPPGRCSWRRRPATRSSWRWPRCSSGCPGCSSGCGPGRSPTGSTGGVLVVVADLLRALVVAVLCLAVATGWVDVDGRARDDVPLRRRRGVRRHRERHAAADAGRARGPRHRQRPAPGGVPHDEPARRAAARGVPLRRGHRVAVRRAGAVRGPRRRARRADRDAARCRARPRGHPRAPRHRRRAAVDRAARAGAHPRARDPRVQRHVGRGVVGARPVLARQAGHGRGGLRPADDGRRGRRAGQHQLVRRRSSGGSRSRR